METVPSPVPLDRHTIQRIRELAELHASIGNDVPELTPSDSENLLKDFTLDLERKVNQIVSECSDVGSLGAEDFDTYFEQLKEELNTVEAESTKISNEIEILARTNVEDSTQLESGLERLECALDFFTSQGLEKVKAPTYREVEPNLMNEHVDHKLELLELEDQIESNKTTLKSLQDLDHLYRWFDTIEQIEDVLAGLKVIAFTENCIRLSLQTYVPKLEGSQKIEDIIEPSVLNHELLIEVLEGTMVLKSVEIFPNDVYIIDILDAAKSLSKSSLQWFMTKVQERITLCTLRHLMVKSANKSRHSFEYLDREETIVAHIFGAVDAFIKIPQGWPVLSSPLKLISLKSSDHSKEISLTFLCKVEEVANSLDVQIRQDISSFGNAIEKILVEQMHLELHSDDALEK
ncbi:e3 ubiquitin-protein ligase rnf14 [Fagus crenata]